MKELSIEQKARAYDEALERAKESLKDGGISQNSIDYIQSIFPELKESCDERIRKTLIKFHKSTIDIDGIKGGDILAWLEKQGEQKPAWGEEDDENIMMIEDRFSDYIDYIREDSSLPKHRKNTLKEEVIGYVNWLKQLKRRMEGK